MTVLRARTDPYLLDGPDVAAELETDPDRGLTSREAERRLQDYGPNRLESTPPVPTWRKILAQFQDPLIYLLLAATAVSFVAWLVEGAEGVPFDSIVIALIVAANAVLGFVQERRAERAVAALEEMTAATAGVIRDGVEIRIPSESVVPGDLLVLAEGDTVSADARLIRAASLRVAEASLTGESEPVLKDASTLHEEVALGDRLNMVFNGTAVAQGTGRAVVTATGMQTEMGTIADLVQETEEEKTPLQRQLAGVGRALEIAIILIAAVVVTTVLLTSDIQSADDVVTVLLLGVSLAVAAVPEGLPAILSVVLAIGVQRMARQRAIVKKLSSVETLGSASVVCSDKTGTLTRNEMTIQRIVTASGEATVTGTGYRPGGEVHVDGGPPADGPLLDEVRAVLAGGSLANDASLREVDGEWVIQGDPTDAAFLVAEHKLGITERRKERFTRVGELPFTSERKLMSSIEVDAQREGRIDVVTKGAPDVLLDRCTHERVGGQEVALTEARRSKLLHAVESLSDQAFRTLAVAYKRLDGVAPPQADESIERGLVYTGMVGIIDPARPEAAGAISEARQAGVRVIMITGDHPRTAARIAADLSITEPGAPALTGLDIDRMTDDEFQEAVRTISVYARVAPQHKLRIVDALQADSNIVAMTGDGVNDAPALKSADIGVAMGITGTEVAKEASKMILADDNFATIIAAVREGRVIFANIKKFLRYLLTSNAGEVLTVFLGVVGATVIGLDATGETIAAPLLAAQILWINLLTDSGPALAMGVDPPTENVMAQPPRRLMDRVINAEMARSVLLIGATMAAVALLAIDILLPGGLVDGIRSLEEARTAGFTTLVLAQLFNCFNSRSERASAFRHLSSNHWLWAAVALSLVLQVAVVHLPLLNDAFGTAPLTLAEWGLCFALASAVLWVDEIKKLAVRSRS